MVLPSVVRRLPHGDASLSRLLLDIHAAHHHDQRVSDPAPPVSRSPAALRGQALRGDVQLPRELQQAVVAILDEVDKPGLRTTALELYAHLRRTSAILPAPSSYREKQASTTAYSPSVALAYLAGLMPSVFGATLHALHAARQRLQVLGDWEPQRVVDYGSGTASAAWAVESVWGTKDREGNAREYVGLDSAKSMVELSSGLLGALSLKNTKIVDEGALHPPVRMLAKTHQLPVPSSAATLAKLHLSGAASRDKRTLALAAFTLGDLGTKEKRKELVRAMWESRAEVLVLVERGTPGGSRMIVEAREQLLMYGKRSLSFEEHDGVADQPKGAFVIAPCPHDGPCPLHHSTRSFCHFSQRVQSPSFLRHTKHATAGADDANFSYVVVQRGVRPSVPSPVQALGSLSATLFPTLGSLALENPPPTATPGEEIKWPRIVASPMKRSGHVVLEVCASSGSLERHTIPKSQGRQAYYDARKAEWGDAFPHQPKNGAQPAPLGRDALATKRVEDKLGKDRSKLKRKKEGRRAVDVEEEGRASSERREQRTKRDRESEVEDFEFELVQ